MPITEQYLNWAVIGTGDVSRFIASDLALVPGARKLAVCSRDSDRAVTFAAANGFHRSYTHIAELLSAPDIDIIYIATPHATHEDIAVKALQAGKHVLIEKPMAINAAQAGRIASAARTSGVFAMEAMWMRFNPAYRAALEAVTAGILGEVRSIRASFGLPFGSPDSEQWSAERASSTLLDQGIYPVTLALDVFGRPRNIAARARLRSDGVDLAHHLTFDYGAERFAHLGASMVEFLEPTASISGTEGWLTLSAPFWATDTMQLHTGGIGPALMSPTTARRPRSGFGYVPMLTAVSEAVLDGRTEHPWHTLSATIATLEILDEIRSTATQLTTPDS